MTVPEISDKRERESVSRDKRERAEAPKEVLYDDFPAGEEIAKRLISKCHPHLVSAKIIFGCRDKAQKKAGSPSPGYVKKVSPEGKWLSGSKVPGDDMADFVLVVALEVWNGMAPNQRTALIDHLLARLHGEEDEKNGSMKWSLRPPSVQEFPEVAERNGKWNIDLQNMADSLGV